MTRGRWITPDETGDSNIARCLSVPEKLQPAVNWSLEQLTFAANWEQVGDLTPDECAEAMADVIAAYYESVCELPAEYPDNFAFFWEEMKVITGNALLVNLNTGIYYAMRWQQSAAAINDELEISCLLRAGTYLLTQIDHRSNVSGQQQWYVDGVAQTGVLELYNSSNQNNHITTKTMVIPDDGVHVLRSKVPSKNASSGGYACHITHVILTRTGA